MKKILNLKYVESGHIFTKNTVSTDVFHFFTSKEGNVYGIRGDVMPDEFESLLAWSHLKDCFLIKGIVRHVGNVELVEFFTFTRLDNIHYLGHGTNKCANLPKNFIKEYGHMFIP